MDSIIYTAVYTGLLALTYIGLSFRVIQQRRRHKVSYGEKNKEGETVQDLALAIAVHNNAGQYVPIFILLLFFIEYQQFSAIFINIVGVAFVVGRLLHASGMTKSNYTLRKMGMMLTLFIIILLAVINILWPIYTLLFAT